MKPATWVLGAAILAGASYVVSWFLPIPAAVAVAWKGSGVTLLAVYAAVAARGPGRVLLAAVLAFGALGDVLLEVYGLVIGALAFLAGHLVAIALYLRQRRTPLGAGDWAPAMALLVAIPLIAYLLPPQRAGAGLIAVYASGLAAMTAAAWLSRFSRTLVGAGAIMFAVSDLLIFARTGRPALDILPMGLAVWGLYFGGQALIAIGAARGLRQLPR